MDACFPCLAGVLASPERGPLLPRGPSLNSRPANAFPPPHTVLTAPLPRLRPLSRLAGILGIPLDLEDMSTKAHSSYDVDHEHNVSSPLSASSRPLSLIEYSELRRGERKERARRDFLAREAEVDRQRAVTDTYAHLMRPVIDRSSLSTTPTTLDYGAMGSTSTSALGLTAVQESGRSRNHSRSRSSSATRVYETDSFGKWSISTTSTRVDKEEEQPKEPKELKNACAGHWTETMTSTLQGHQNGIPTRYGTPPAGQTAAAMAPTPKPWYDEIFTHPPPSPNARYPPGLMVTPASFFGNHPSTVPPLASPVSPRTVLPALLPDPSARDTQFRDRLNSMFGVGGADCLSPISPISSRPSSRTSSRTHSRTTSRVQEYDEDDPVWKTIGLAALNVPGTLARRRRHHRRGTRVMWADQVEKKEREKETAKEKEKEKGDGIEEKMPLQCAAA